MSDTVLVCDAHNLSGSFARDAMLQCYDACRIDGHCLGWLPKLAYDQARDRGRIATCWRNADLVGFLMWGATLRTLKIYQTWVRKDARMIEHGRALVTHLTTKAPQTAAVEIRLWCAEDLPANRFWQALHFERRTWRWSPHQVRRRHILWTRAITPSCVPAPLHVPANRQQPAQLSLTTPTATPTHS